MTDNDEKPADGNPSAIQLKMQAFAKDRVTIDAFVGDHLVLSGAANPRGQKSRKAFLDQLEKKVDIDSEIREDVWHMPRPQPGI